MSNIQNVSVIYTVDICGNRYTSGFLDGIYISFLLGLAACIYMFMKNMKHKEESSPIVINVYTNKDEDDEEYDEEYEYECDCEDEDCGCTHEEQQEEEEEEDGEAEEVEEEEQAEAEAEAEAQQPVEETTQTEEKTTVA